MINLHDLRKGSILEKVTITDGIGEGRGLARVDGLVVFIDGGVPGDVADVRIKKIKSNYCEAVVLKVHEPSPHRATPFCEHFGTCGGCVWQHLDYETQLSFKQKQVEDAMQRLGKIESPVVLPIIPSAKTKHYRNRLDFTFSTRPWTTAPPPPKGGSKEESPSNAAAALIPPLGGGGALGYHAPGRFDKVIDIHKCWLQDDLSNQIRNAVKEIAVRNGLTFYDQISQQGFLRNMVLRNTTTGEWMVIVIFRDDVKNDRDLLLNEMAEKFPQINSLLYIINGKRNDSFSDLDVHVFKGVDHITEVMKAPPSPEAASIPPLGGGGAFKISAKSFYQTNSEQAFHLYNTARDFAALTGNELVYDLYTGTGTIAIFVAANARKVIGIDYTAAAIEDARTNSIANGVHNTEFFAGDIKETFTHDFVATHGHPHVVITDPPRAGMHPDVVKRLLEIAPQRIVYVSCNPATQARDVNMLLEKYNVEKLQPVDMFPHTSHVENVALLIKKG